MFTDWCYRLNDIEGDYDGFTNEEICMEWGSSLYRWIYSQGEHLGFRMAMTEDEFLYRFVRLVYKFQ